jgi:ABC-type lipoprotein release transport system permease subunit
VFNRDRNQPDQYGASKPASSGQGYGWSPVGAGRGPAEATVPPDALAAREGVLTASFVWMFLALLAMVAIGHTLVSTVRRRRADLGVLKALGFDRGQVRATVAWQASLLAAVGLVLGVPLGVAAGRWAWKLVADGVGVVNRPEVPLAALATIVPAAVLIANVIAALPARVAARTQPAVVLRTE